MRLDRIPAMSCGELNTHVATVGVRDEAGRNYPTFWGATTYNVLVNGQFIDEFSAEGVDYDLRPLPGSRTCWAASRIGIKFDSETEMTRLEWPPTLGCEEVWRERVEVIERHEPKHVAIVEKAVDAANSRWRRRVFQACSGRPAEVQRLLGVKIAKALVSEHALVVKEIETGFAELDRREWVKPLDCRRCAVALRYAGLFRNDIAGSGANFPKGWADWTNHFVIRLTGEVPLTPSGQPGVFTGEGPIKWGPNSEITVHETGWFYEIPTDTQCDYTRDIVAVGFRPGSARVRLTVGPRDPANPAGLPPLDLEFTLDAVAEDLEDTWVVTAGPCPSTRQTRTGRNAIIAFRAAHGSPDPTARIDTWEPGDGDVIASHQFNAGVIGQDLGSCSERWEIVHVEKQP
ncbi:hypothetical protein [Virgisporangium aurantiacum]|uniref:Uncharacterized protein n=1 Tax=Virgisporangium aurantiacum TaxID=175570 RepID=A0A8J3Z1M5_9ACTN|nr:hypothetical protein [Virgisporangium aurantiacum]GIJ54872.1 hypothetical protein Vau01_023880 [Virgisporangium aurantiacum]